jgi:hypothetical protein
MEVKSQVDEAPTIGEVNQIAPPVTECLVDANLPGGLYERMATTGGSIEMGGTTVVPIAQKQDVMAENSTEAEIDAAAFLGKILRWMVLFMSDLGLPFQGPIPIGEDNAATRIIAHSGKDNKKCPTCSHKNIGVTGTGWKQDCGVQCSWDGKQPLGSFHKALATSSFPCTYWLHDGSQIPESRTC